MNTHNKSPKWVKRISGSLFAIMLAISSGGQAHARILFEDDDYFNVQSEGIILDQNDNMADGTLSTNTYTMADAACLLGETYTATINGTAVVYTATTADCAGADSADTAAVLQGLTAAIDADYTVGFIVDAVYSANTITITATVADPSNNYTTTAADTSAAGTLVATGANLAGGVLGDTVDLQFGNDGSDALISYDPNNQNLTLSAPGGMFDFTDDSLRTSGVVQFQGASEFHIREETNEATAACTTVGEILLDTGENRIYVCTATGSPGTWAASDSGSSQDFDDVYDISQSGGNLTMEIDNGSLNFNITTADSFTIQDGGVAIGEFTGAGAVLFDPTSGQNFDVTTLGAGDIVLLSADDIDVDGATFNLDTTSTFSLDGVGASNITTDSGNLTLNTTTSGDVDITGTTNVDIASTNGDITFAAGDDVIFDDAQLVGVVQLTDTATDWAATLAGDGIIDNINSFTLTTNGNGASNVGIEDASTWFAGAEVEAALNEIEALFGSTTSSTFNFTEDNVLADNDAVYAALDKLDLEWGDLGSTNNGEGASMVGIEDVGTYFTGTDVEAALQELGADISNNYEDLTFYPEYPDATVFQDGSNNKGTLEGLYDDTEKTGYYNWTTTKGAVHDIDIRFQFPLPTDFSATGDFTYRYRTGTATEAQNDLEIRLYEVAPTSETLCGSDVAGNFGTSWATGTIAAGSITGCTLAAGDIVEVRIKLFSDNTASAAADIGEITWNYTK
jgi:hypothetical protein